MNENSSCDSHPSPHEKTHVMANVTKADASTEERAVMIVFQNTFPADVTMFRAWRNIDFTTVAVMPIAM